MLQQFAARYPEKSWNFPKRHWREHAYTDIEDKGVAHVLSTKPFEKCHRPLKNSFRDRSNFKNVAGQVRMYLLIRI